MACDPNTTITKEELSNLKTNTTVLNEVVTLDSFETNTAASDGNKKRTLRGIEALYIQTPINGGIWASGIEFNAYNQYMAYNGVPYKPKLSTTLPYTTQGSDPTIAPDSNFVEPFSDINSSTIGNYAPLKFDTIADMKASPIIKDGDFVQWAGYNSSLDGGGNSGVVKTGAHTEDNGTIFTISGSLYVEADVGLSLRSAQFGVFPGSTDMTQLNRWFSYCYVNRVSMLAYPGTYNVTSSIFSDAVNAGSLTLKCLTSEAIFNYTGATEILSLISVEGLDDADILNIRITANDLCLRPFSLRNTIGTPAGGVTLTNVSAVGAKETALNNSVFNIFIDGEYKYTNVIGGESNNCAYTTPGNSAAALTVNNASGIVKIDGHSVSNVTSPDNVNADGIVVFGNGIGDVTVKITASAEITNCKVNNCAGRFIKSGVSNTHVHSNQFSLTAPFTLNSDWRGIDIQANNGNIHDNTHDYDAGIVTDTETTIYVLQNIRNDGTNKASFVYNERISTGTPIRQLASCFSRYENCAFTISDIDVKGAPINFGVRHQTFGLADTTSMSLHIKDCEFEQISTCLFAPFDDIDYLGKLYIEIVNNEDKSSPFSDLILQSLATFSCGDTFKIANNPGFISRVNWPFDMNNLYPGNAFFTGGQVVANRGPNMTTFFHVKTDSFIQYNFTGTGAEEHRVSYDGVSWSSYVS